MVSPAAATCSEAEENLRIEVRMLVGNTGRGHGILEVFTGSMVSTRKLS